MADNQALPPMSQPSTQSNTGFLPRLKGEYNSMHQLADAVRGSLQPTPVTPMAPGPVLTPWKADSDPVMTPQPQGVFPRIKADVNGLSQLYDMYRSNK